MVIGAGRVGECGDARYGAAYGVFDHDYGMRKRQRCAALEFGRYGCTGYVEAAGFAIGGAWSC